MIPNIPDTTSKPGPDHEKKKVKNRKQKNTCIPVFGPKIRALLFFRDARHSLDHTGIGILSPPAGIISGYSMTASRRLRTVTRCSVCRASKLLFSLSRLQLHLFL